MSNAPAFDFGKFIPGFDFLQKLAIPQSGLGGSAPGSWIAPTVSVDELDRRIQELKAVQFWLDQNATAIKATIQALEVQKMTLATLQGMNLSMTEVVKSLTLPAGQSASPAGWPYAAAAPSTTPSDAAAAPPPAEEPPAPAKPARHARKTGQSVTPKATRQPAPAAGMADPVQWWGALTQQFQQIAANALREAGEAVPRSAIDSEAAAAHPASASGTKGVKNTAPGRKAASKKTARKKAARPAARKPAARPARASSQSGWPLPPFKPPR